MLELTRQEQLMPDNSELPPSPPTFESGPVIDPSPTAVPAVPRPTAPAPPSTTSSPWFPHFDAPSAASAGPPPVGTAPPRARRAAPHGRTRAIVGGSSVAAFLAILAAVGIHGRSQPAANVTAANDGSATSFDPGFVRPNLGQGSLGSPYGGSQSGGFGSSQDDPFSQGFSGGGFSATPGTGAGSAHTRSHGS
jgi:hypothetical protein